MDGRKVVVFCSSVSEIDPAYKEAARELTRALHASGFSLVSGGGERGLMGECVRASAACGGVHSGVLPRFMKGLESPSLTEAVWTDTMAERKEKMREGTCAAIALPGGIGTLDELIETHTLKKLDRYAGKLYALNVNGFYDPLKALLDHYVATGMMTRADASLLQFPATVAELMADILK